MKKYTWNEIYAAAEGCGCGESGLRAKDNARENVRCLALERGEADLEEAECPEDEVEYYSKGLYSVTANERIAKAKARCSKADKAFAEAKKKLDATAAKNPVDKFKQAVDDVMEELEIIYDVYKAPDFTEIKGETGGDLRCMRVYKDGSVCEK